MGKMEQGSSDPGINNAGCATVGLGQQKANGKMSIGCDLQQLETGEAYLSVR